MLNSKQSINPSLLGVLLPVVMLLRPQVEAHLQKECLKVTASDDQQLAQIMEKPCKDIARPIADCLLREAEGSGRLIGIISDVIAKKYGDASEHVTKLCLAKTFGLPRDSLAKVPLSKLIENMQRKNTYNVPNNGKDDKSSFPGTPPIK